MEIKNSKNKDFSKYEELLINKVKIESMHERYLKQSELINKMSETISIYCNACFEFSDKNPLRYIKLYAKEIFDPLTKNIRNTNYEIYNFISNQKSVYENLAKSLKEEVISQLPKDLHLNRDERDLFNKSKIILKEYNNLKYYLEKYKNEYNKNFKILENYYREREENKVDKSKNEYKIKKTIESLKSWNKKYKDTVKEINLKKVEKINIEKDLLHLYQKSDFSIFNKIEDKIWKFVGLITKVNETNIKLMNELIDKYGRIDVATDIKDYMNSFAYIQSTEEHFIYEPYKPESSNMIDKIITDEKEREALNINYRIIAELKKDFSDICPNLNMAEENDKCQLLDMTQNLFNPTKKISNMDVDKIMFWVKNPKFRKYIIISFSNQRTKGRYERSWGLIFTLGKILNEILKFTEQDKNYEDVKHCIILSQTFFCVDKRTKNKYYLFEYIKNNKWLKSQEFWDEITDCMIEKEIESNNKVLGKEALEKETIEQRRERKSQVCISQLLTFSENMIDFGLSKEEIDKIIKKKVEKFEIVNQFEQLIYEHIDKTLIDKQKNKDFVEEDEISHFLKIRRNSLKKFKKPIALEDIVFNNDKDTKSNKKIRKEKSVKYNMKLKLERNTIIQNVKKEIILDRKNCLKISNNKSEAIKTNNLMKIDIGIENNKRYNFSIGNKINIDNNDKNEIIINDKNEIIEEKEFNEENKKEEPKEKKKEEEIKEEPIQKEGIEKESNKKELKEENNIEYSKERPINNEPKIEHLEQQHINEENKKENDVKPLITEENKNEEIKKEIGKEQSIIEEHIIESIKEQPINEELKSQHVEEKPINEEPKNEHVDEKPLNEEPKNEHFEEQPVKEEHKNEKSVEQVNEEHKKENIEEKPTNEENKNENNVGLPPNEEYKNEPVDEKPINEEIKNDNEQEEPKIENKIEEDKQKVENKE